MKSETYINQESSTIDTFSGKQKFVSVDVALKAVEMARDAEQKKIQKLKDDGTMSDGYHTFNELYDYRKAYNAAFFNEIAKKYKVLKSKRHSDGEECFGGGWFIVMAELPTGQVSNHYELKDWNLFKCKVQEKADVWDGHTPAQALERAIKYIKTKQ